MNKDNASGMTTGSITDRAALMASQFLNGTTDGIDPQDVAGLLGELCSALTAAESRIAALEASARAAESAMSEALNSGDGSYRP